jgi:voltage-gated potassium channel
MNKYKKRVYEIIQINHLNDAISRIFDIVISIAIVLNLFITLFITFDIAVSYKTILYIVDAVTVLIFSIEYILRLWTVEYKYPNKSKFKAICSFVFSFFGIVDLLTIISFFLPYSISTGMVAFRMLRVARVFQLFKANKYYNSFNVITSVLKDKKDQIMSSVFIILILMTASSLCMYSLEHNAQPDKFSNAFSGIWWSVSTLLTVGYGDIYPITTLGKIMAIIIAFLGVGMVAIPTGIISAGFVEYHSKLKAQINYMEEQNVRFVVIRIKKGHSFENLTVKELNLPNGLIVSTIIRDEQPILPHGNIVIKEKDKIVIAAEAFKDDIGIKLKEIKIKEEHPWKGHPIRALDISRQTLIIIIKRRGKVIVPDGDTVIKEGDVMIVYTKKDIEELIDGIDIDL